MFINDKGVIDQVFLKFFVVFTVFSNFSVNMILFQIVAAYLRSLRASATGRKEHPRNVKELSETG